jgi:patatin-like phospholipase/acyl hydrolase
LLADIDQSSFVTAIRKDAVDNRALVLLRSYQNPLEMSELSGIEIWKAARATSAAPTYFKSTVAGDVELVDGGLGINNPLGW